MAGTFAQLHYHLVFNTKHRAPTIDPAWKIRLWDYLGGIVRGEGGISHRIGGIDDHVHLLVTLKPVHSLSNIVQKVKANSSGWIHDTLDVPAFGWQDGYGAFTVSHSAIPDVIAYIDNQEEHHHTTTFQEEFVRFLEKHGIEYDERYLWV